jgi:DNA polymerase III gamma/tau subunit
MKQYDSWRVRASKAVAEYKIYSISPAQYSKINELASQLSLASLMKIWHLLIKAKTEIDLASNQKNSFEILLIKLCFAVSIPDLQKILLDLKPDNLNKNDVNLLSKSAEISKKLSKQDLSAELNLNQENDSEIIAEILRNFPQAKLVN